MKDTTQLVLEYAQARMAVWNGFFRRLKDASNSNQIVEDFQEIDRLLLSSVIRRATGSPLPSEFFLGESSISQLEITLRKSIPHADALVTAEVSGFANSHWRRGFELSHDRPIRIEFVEFFDWEQTGFMTNSLCRGRIAAFEDKDLVGHDVLIEVWLVDFLVADGRA
jgi:hypothetical protein